MNMFTDPIIGPILTVIFIICCLGAAVFIIAEAWPKKPLIKVPPTRYEEYIVLEDGTIIYPLSVDKTV